MDSKLIPIVDLDKIHGFVIIFVGRVIDYRFTA